MILLEETNSNEYYFIKFINNTTNLNKLTDFIKKALNDNYHANTLSIFMNICDKYKDNSKYNNITNTTRMSIIELYL